MGDQTKITEAIQAASDELHAIQQQLEQLRRLEHRAKQLEDFMAAGRILLGETLDIDGKKHLERLDVQKENSQNHRPQKRGKRTVGDCERALFEERKTPIPLQEITQELLQRKLVTGKWAREVIRTALKRGKEFERVAPGVYALKYWPAEFKRWPLEGSYPLYQPSMTGEPQQNGTSAEADTERDKQSESYREESLLLSQ